ncbi:diadenylate cyclase CdaA [Geobacter sp. AOG2]|uniref:diadenylate cyclase CdaA n=1 Tax=Geobacter sp. AOG2 TaxID=1566347 RepID=UPI001CC4CB8F|nr:diadenylate cyclase CdaA [Geobacter sp. AOG2]GFE61418.1 membrane protein [Geobacter sp. AOG2]
MPGLLDNSTLLDLCDILIVAVLVYHFSLVLKKDAAVRLLIFLLIFFACFYFALLSGFSSTTWLLRTIFSSALIILAIIFQGDIRRALLSLGRRPVTANTQDETTETIEELTKAVGEMSKKRIGALIVIVRRLPIDHLVEVGTEIDAKVTSELLNSIFLPYSPIHDGAVIIHNGKLTKAGCLLPLSKNPDIAKSFGTRHRAALGLSELVDALVMVVSEETGNISLVHDGKIYYDLEQNEIRRMLRKSLDFRRIQKVAAVGETIP